MAVFEVETWLVAEGKDAEHAVEMRRGAVGKGPPGPVSRMEKRALPREEHCRR
jgi:hypothetical protein